MSTYWFFGGWGRLLFLIFFFLDAVGIMEVCVMSLASSSFSSEAWLVGDRLWGIMVRVPGYRSGSPGSIPDATRFSEKYLVERSPLILVSTIVEPLERKNSGSDLEIREYSRKDSSRSPRDTPLSIKVVTNFADKLGRYSSIEDSDQGV
jgi:hypothetical protein